MLESIFFVSCGLALLAVGGEFLVRSASSIAIAYGISPLLVGLTIVSFGTSAPELGVSLISALQGNPEIALTNVVGSNIFNIGFILGLCAIVSPLAVNLNLIRFDVPIMVFVSLLSGLFFWSGAASVVEGMLLVAGAVFYTIWLIRTSDKEPEAVKDSIELLPSRSRKRALIINLLLIISSLVVLVFGSRMLVSGAVDLARLWGVSEGLIGLTIIAAGTSLPEVATSLMATIRRQTDIAVGNVIGSNVLNLLFILGLSVSLSGGFEVTSKTIYLDLVVMCLFALVCYPFLVSSKKLVRWEGSVLLSGYVAYTVFLVVRG